MAADPTTAAPKVDISKSIPIYPQPSSTSSSANPLSTSTVLSPAIPDSEMIGRMASVYGLDPDIINKQVMQESGGKPDAISKKGAIGMMQLMPDTAARLGVTDPHNAIQNIDGGMREMSRLLGKYNGDYSKALAAYNAGEHQVDKANGVPDIDETRNYVKSILKGTPYEVKDEASQPKLDMSKSINIDMSKSIPINGRGQPSDQPGALSRFAGAATESSSGLPADIKQWPSAISSLTNNPITGKPYSNKDIIPPEATIPTNLIKGIVTGSASASQRGIDQFNQPGAINKTVGGLKYLIGGLPVVGPNIVRSMEAAENGDYAGMLGTLTGIGLQAAMANPEATVSRVAAAGKYLFSKPRVQETILAGEAKEMLANAESTARAKGHSLFPDSDASLPGLAVSNVANKAISDNIAGTPETPGPLKSMTSEDALKRIGAIERVGGGLQDIFAKITSNDPVSMKDAQGYYTELGRYGSRDLPGDVYRAVKQARDGLGELIGDQYQSEGKLSQWQDAKAYWSDLHKYWWDSDSPLNKALNSADPRETLQSLLGAGNDSAERSSNYLGKYVKEGADPNIIKAATTFYKGMNQMQIRGLYQASGGLLLAMMMRSSGIPGAEVAGGIGTLLGARLGMGYLRTRPSLTSLLSEEVKPSSWRAFPLKGGDTNISGNPSPFGPEPPAPVGGTPPIAPLAPREVMQQPSSTSRATPTGEAVPLPAGLHSDLESQAGHKLSDADANALHRANIEHDMAASTLTPTESSFLSAIKDHPSIHPEVKADIEAATGSTKAANSPQSIVESAGGVYRGVHGNGDIEITLPRSMTDKLRLPESMKDFVSITVPIDKLTPDYIKSAIDAKYKLFGGR